MRRRLMVLQRRKDPTKIAKSTPTEEELVHLIESSTTNIVVGGRHFYCRQLDDNDTHRRYVGKLRPVFFFVRSTEDKTKLV
jgi:hypothetical protein